LEEKFNANNSLLSVAFDISRLIKSINKGWYYTGITKYVKRLYNIFQDGDIELIPVITEKVNSSYFELRNTIVSLLGREPVILSDKCEDDAVFPKFDIYHSPVDPLPSFNLTRNAKRIITIHDCIHIKYPELHPKGNPPIKAVLESLSPSDDFAICVSESTRLDFLSFIQMPKDHICVIPSAADRIFFHQEKENLVVSELLSRFDIKPHNYIFALAQAEPRKNIERLIKAFSYLLKENVREQIVLALISHHRYCDHYTNLFFKYHIPNKFFRVISNVDNQTLALLYQNAIMFAYVSLYEGFGLPILEAMASGCPVMLSNSSSLPEVGGDAGYYINPKNEISIADGLKNIIINSELRRDMALAGKHQALKFSWERTRRETLDFYKSVLKIDKS